jgi:uncharacterized protein
MDDSGIQKSVLHIIDDNEFLGQMELSLLDIYKVHYGVLKNNANRFEVFAGFNPNRKNGFELLKKGIESFGFKGVKLYPLFGFRLNHPELKKCFDYCNNNSLTILIHTGPSIYDLDDNGQIFKDLDRIAPCYSNVDFIMAHAGYKLDCTIIQDLLKRENVYADISGFQSIRNSEEGVNTLRMIFDKSYNKKIVFGSDWPINNMMKPILFQIELLKKLEQKTSFVSQEYLNNILYNNAKALLKA